MVEVLFHAAKLEGQPVEPVVDLQHMAGLEGGVGGGARRLVLLDVGAVGCQMLGPAVLADMGEHLLFQGEAGELLQPHQFQVHRGDVGAALGLDGDHVGDVQHDEGFPHGGAADPHLFGQLAVVERVARLELHRDDPAPKGLVRRLTRACRCCHTACLLSVRPVLQGVCFLYHCKLIFQPRQWAICSNFINYFLHFPHSFLQAGRTGASTMPPPAPARRPRR